MEDNGADVSNAPVKKLIQCSASIFLIQNVVLFSLVFCFCMGGDI